MLLVSFDFSLTKIRVSNVEYFYLFFIFGGVVKKFVTLDGFYLI